MPRLRLAFQQAEGLAHCVCNWRIEVQDLSSGSPSEDETGHLLSTVSGSDISTEFGQRHYLAALDLSQPFLDRAQGLIVGQDFCCLFKCVVFVDRKQDRRRSTSAGHYDVLTQVGDAVDEVS